MRREPSHIGDETTDVRYTLLYLAGVVIGTGVRVVAWVLPAELVSTVKDKLP